MGDDLTQGLDICISKKPINLAENSGGKQNQMFSHGGNPANRLATES